MKKLILFSALFAATLTNTQAQNIKVVSPDKGIELVNSPRGVVVNYHSQPVITLSRLGMTVAGQEAVTRKLDQVSKTRKVYADYMAKVGKRSHCTNQGIEYAMPINDKVTLVLRVYNDGVVFRYDLKGLSNDVIGKELTTYHIPEGVNRWIQKWTQPYEEFFDLSQTSKGKDHHWGYPALVSPQDNLYALITEADVNRTQSASSLISEGEDYTVMEDENNLRHNGNWHTPWRVLIVGDAAKVVESTLVNDVSKPSSMGNTTWIKPSVVSWVYWAYNHGSNDYQIVKKYIDMAARLKLPRVLIDAEWDEMKNGGTIDDALKYAKEKGVKPLIWYNSTTAWIDGAPGPKYRLNDSTKCEAEFARLEEKGVDGVKIDFFDGDKQATMEYCIRLLECAARHHLAVDLHGATIPRGWARTYPNLMTTEGVYGAEWYNNRPTMTNKAACHNATLPFTRNVIGSMDYTPCAFSDSQFKHITSSAHELALTVLFESGLQHIADKPESIYAQPQEVQDFFGKLPAAWDDIKFVCGRPGENVILARRKGTTWYVAGINGSDQPFTFKDVKLPFIKKTSKITLFSDGASQLEWKITSPKDIPSSFATIERGGFVMVVE